MIVRKSTDIFQFIKSGPKKTNENIFAMLRLLIFGIIFNIIIILVYFTCLMYDTDMVFKKYIFVVFEYTFNNT